MEKCNLCPMSCNVDREISTGRCGAKKLKIARADLHYFEEPIICGKNGSGTVFFCGCNLRCIFCQNYDVSRNKVGKEISTDGLIDIFKMLEDKGAENINLVTATPYVDDIITALTKYKPSVPVLFNSSGYEKIDTIKRLLPYVDIFLPDLKFYSPILSSRYTGLNNYFEVASKAVEFLSNNLKTVVTNGQMKSGLIVRHLVLPQGVSDSIKVLNFIKERVRDEHYVSIMSQYTPFGEIDNCPELQRKITSREYDKVVAHAEQLNFSNCFIQDKSSSSKEFIPKWNF